MSVNSSIAISIAQLLELRHRPVHGAQGVPPSNSPWMGAFKSRRRGHGTEYDDLRAYNAGDDIRHIDWRVSARTQELHTRLYTEEKKHRTTIICDLRTSMFTGSQELRANRATLIAARLLWLACEGGTQVTLMVLHADGVSMVEPGYGHAMAIRGCTLLSNEHQRIASTLFDQHTRSAHAAANAADKPYQRKTAISSEQSPLTAQRHLHPLEVDANTQEPSLKTLLQWIIAQREHKSTLLWISALDFPGDQFLDTVSTLAPPSQSVFVYVDEPMLRTGLVSGDYHYHTHHGNNSTHRPAFASAFINTFKQGKLLKKLRQTQQTRTDTLQALMIPYVSTQHGDEEMINALRHFAYLP